ncbi:N-acetyltransferase [archaeon AH-315-M20]|nr:N-acetyltransferase [archaeon AH-315-M20]
MVDTAIISKEAKIGKGTKIWNFAEIREKAKIGDNCIIGKNVYIDHDVKIGSNVKIQNNSSVYYDSEIEDGVFIGPHVCLTNDKTPRAITHDGKLKKNEDWNTGKIIIKKGASIGAGSIILPDIKIGQFAMTGSGSVVTKDVPNHALVYGNPAKQHGYVCKCGYRFEKEEDILKCHKCGNPDNQ